jgi:uncharacterized coiled-coil protein SlyX
MELEQRVTRLEERTVAVERDIKEIKSQLNETAKRSDVERLEKIKLDGLTLPEMAQEITP